MLIAASQWTVFFTAAAVTVLMALVSWFAFGIESWQAFFHWMPMFSQAFLTEGKATWWKLQSLFSLVRYFGGTEHLAWVFQWILSATVAVTLAVMWRSRISYSLKAAALATGTLLITPYLFMYDMMVLAIPVAFLVRIGLRTGFRHYELPALACAMAFILGFIFVGAPLGLGATLIVAGLSCAAPARGAACAGAGADVFRKRLKGRRVRRSQETRITFIPLPGVPARAAQILDAAGPQTPPSRGQQGRALQICVKF